MREALGLAFDFEWTNKNIFYGLYKRTQSFFENSDMKAEGMPSPEELALLEPFRGQAAARGVRRALHAAGDATASGQRSPVAASEAARAAHRGGLQVKDGKPLNAKGEMLELEFLISDRLRAHHQPYVNNLKRIGIQASIRRVDPGAVRAARQVVRLRRGRRSATRCA